ncbi:cupin domain-containing protein [Oceanisphaera psychrotolerans]|uniref:50S ribosomal protein L16 arginine hydroxylase n=1 Tax=Oceanisphaera psychrotolerans TaxID=1414654 RepID=A0A1J4QB12_9GAMM|nr:cupin domain-containing protein [Oceanisphaera psychrotolerans]OIN07410.1 50S ribosomal protein L16 arginine hydroxylase [Oceanisphaera psychrotolerans]
MYSALKLDIDDFLANDWQRKPRLIKAGFHNFVDPLSPDELAGLALEPHIESRRVWRADDRWHAETGPFESYDHLGETDWTLLVQAVNQWHPAVQDVAESFRFIPGWRFDDVMVSFSTPGGGVGPHIDQYGVFIIQGEGRRRWRVGLPQTLQQFAAHGALRHCEDFVAEIDEVLEPGDVLYIPPGCPHEGYAETPALNYSVGFRAPDAKDLMSGFADHLLAHVPETRRFDDTAMAPCEAHGRINHQAMLQVKALMTELLDDPVRLADWFGEMISEAKHDLDLEPAEPLYSLEELVLRLDHGDHLYRLAGARCFYMEGSEDVFYLDGDRYQLTEPDADAIALLCDQARICGPEVACLKQPQTLLEVLLPLVNQGYWYFEEDE